jgi:hypothetical protein
VDLHAFIRSRMRCIHVAERRSLAPGCRLGQCSKVGSYLEYTGRAANVAGDAASDPAGPRSRLPHRNISIGSTDRRACGSLRAGLRKE